MPNPLRGEVPLPGTDYVLRYSINALCEIEADSGENMLALLAKLDSGEAATFTQARLLLWGGLRAAKRGRGLSLDQVGDVIEKIGVATAMTAMSEALREAFGKGEPDEKKA